MNPILLLATFLLGAGVGAAVAYHWMRRRAFPAPTVPESILSELRDVAENRGTAAAVAMLEKRYGFTRTQGKIALMSVMRDRASSVNAA